MTAEQIVQKASEGDPFAQYILAELHGSGSNGFTLDEHMATVWLEKSISSLKPLAQQGHAEAQYLLGQIYLKFNFYTPFADDSHADTPLSMAYLEQAAQQNHLWAQLRLASIYTKNNLNIETNAQQAQHWGERALPQLIQSAKQGDPRAQRRLDFVYERGEFAVTQDAQKALYWRQKALEGYRHEVASSLSTPHLLKPSHLLSLTSVYLSESTLSNPVKAYTIASFIANNFPQDTIWNQIGHGIQRKAEPLMSPTQRTQADHLAEQCNRALTDECY